MAHSIVAFGGDCHDGVGGLKVFSPSLDLAQTLVGYVGIRWVGFGRSQGKVASGRVCKCLGTPDGKQLATGSLDNLIKTLQLQRGKCHLSDTRWRATPICSGSWDVSIKFWNPADGSLVKSIHTNTVNSVSYSPNGRALVSAGDDKTMKIWDAETFRAQAHVRAGIRHQQRQDG